MPVHPEEVAELMATRKRGAKAKATRAVGQVDRRRGKSISSGVGVEQGGGTSQQIPIEVLQRMANEIIAPPLDTASSRSFEDFARLLLDSTDYAACVFQTATDVAGLGWHLDPMSQDEQMSDAEVEIAATFFGSPNPNTTTGDLVKSAIIDHLTLGNAWIEVLRQADDPKGLPSGLVHAPGIAMRLRSNLKGFVMLGRDTNLHRFFRTLFSDPSDPSSIDAEKGRVLNEMIYFRNYHPASPWYGVPRIVPAMRAIRGNLFSVDRNIRYFTNRAFPEYLITLEGQTDNIPELELLALEEDIQEHFRNLIRGDDYKTFMATLPVGVTLKLERLAAPFDDETLRQYRIDNRDEIVRSQGMMPNRIGIIESGNLGGGTGESQIEIYKTSTVKPLQEMVERVFDAILHSEKPLGFGLKTVRFKFDELDSTDEMREAQIALALSNTGWLTVNDGRAYASQFLKLVLDPIDEPWADLPLQVVIPQLASFFDSAGSSLQTDAGVNPGLSSFGTPQIGVPGALSFTDPQGRAVIGATVAVDKAYRRFRARREAAAATPDLAAPAANGS